MAVKSPPDLYRLLRRLAWNVRGQHDTETLKTENDTSPLFPSNDLPDVMLLCSRSHYSSVIDQNDGAQWHHKMSGAWEREEEKGGSRSTMLRFWNHLHFSIQGKVEVILYLGQRIVSIFFLPNYTICQREQKSLKITLPNEKKGFFCAFLICWPILACRRGLGTIAQNMYCASMYCTCMCTSEPVSLYLLCCSLPNPFCLQTKKDHAQAKSSVDKPNRQVVTYPTAKGKKWDWSKRNWEQTKETEFSTGFTAITTEACDSHSSFLSIAPTFILLLTTSACSEIQRCSVSISNTHILSFECRHTGT